MRKTFHLPLLATLPALLAACGGDDDLDLDRYKRTSYSSYQRCLAENRVYIERGMQNPCQKSGRSYYGPYMYFGSSTTRYVGYTPSGGLASTGLTYDSKKGTYGSFKAPVSRGGFTSTSRASSSSSGGYGG
ncbi:hypothetical protein [Deinococcus planocerae]|uniref:hypothetical protein n=1 Tax=Deinococcus planocerae TaxID=1737569 RepID=UPI000C7E904D|nr:hypothetical protein [Deinococcus planocerae]